MHNAPSVSYPVGRCAFAARLWVAQAGASALLLGLWAESAVRSAAASLAWLLALLCMGVSSVWGWRDIRQGTGRLSWDGQVWRWRSEAQRADPECIGEVKIVLDAQKALLLKWQPASDTLRSGPCWLWLAEETCPMQWQDLRRAVHGPHRH
jgi:toxin CptA